MKVHELISKLQAMPSDLDVVVFDSKEELVIATDITFEGLWGRDGWVSRYNHPALNNTAMQAIVIE